MKKNVRQNISFKEFFKELKAKEVRYSIFLALSLFLLFLPGQNYYQTLGLVSYPALVQDLPINLPKTSAYPEKITSNEIFSLSAQGAILMDADSQVVMYQKNVNMKLLPASTTKIMTAIVALENYHPDTVLTAWESVSESTSDAALMGLQSGDKVSARNLLYGLLLNSGADAAETLAQNFPGGKTAFLTTMNKKATQLHLSNTHFVNEIGLDSSDQYTTVLDLARLTSYAITKPLFAKVVATKEVTVSDYFGNKKYYLKNINKLLGVVWGVDGVKTGYTLLSGECLVASAQRNGHRLISVLLKSDDRFGESQTLLEWGFGNFSWRSY